MTDWDEESLQLALAEALEEKGVIFNLMLSTFSISSFVTGFLYLRKSSRVWTSAVAQEHIPRAMQGAVGGPDGALPVKL